MATRERQLLQVCVAQREQGHDGRCQLVGSPPQGQTVDPALRRDQGPSRRDVAARDRVQSGGREAAGFEQDVQEY